MHNADDNSSTQPNSPVSHLAIDTRLYFPYTIFCAAAHGVTFNSELWSEEYSDAVLNVAFYITPILYCVMALYESCLIRRESEIARVLFESTSMAPLLYMCFYITAARPPDKLSARAIVQVISVTAAVSAHCYIFYLNLYKFCDKTQPQIHEAHKFTLFCWLVLLSSMISGGLPIPVMAQSCLSAAVFTISLGKGKAYFDFYHSQLTHQSELAASGEGAPYNTQLFGQDSQGSLGVGLSDVFVAITAGDNGESRILARSLMENVL